MSSVLAGCGLGVAPRLLLCSVLAGCGTACVVLASRSEKKMVVTVALATATAGALALALAIQFSKQYNKFSGEYNKGI